MNRAHTTLALAAALAVTGLARPAAAATDPVCVVPYDYVDFGRKLACSGADTTAIARTLLARPSFDIEQFRAPHIIKLARWESLLFLLAPLSSAQLKPALTEWLTQRKLGAAQLELITVAALLFDGDVQQ